MQSNKYQPKKPISTLGNKVCLYCGYNMNKSSAINCELCNQNLSSEIIAIQPNLPAKIFPTKKIAVPFPTALIAAMIGSLLLIGGSTAYLMQKASLQQLKVEKEEKAITNVAIAARNLEQFIRSHYLQVQEMAASPFLNDPALWSAWTLKRKKEYFENNFLVNSDGMDSFVIIDAPTGNTILSGGTGTKSRNYKHIDYYQQVVKFKKPAVIPYRESTKTGVPYMYMAAPSFDNQGNLLFITRIRIRFDYLQSKIANNLDELNRVVGGYSVLPSFFLIDNIGKVIATENPENAKTHINKFFSEAHLLRQNEHSAVKQDVHKIDGTPYLMAYSPIVETEGLPELDWSLILAAEETSDDIFSNKMLLILLAETAFCSILLIQTIPRLGT